MGANLAFVWASFSFPFFFDFVLFIVYFFVRGHFIWALANLFCPGPIYLDIGQFILSLANFNIWELANLFGIGKFIGHWQIYLGIGQFIGHWPIYSALVNLFGQ